jgi:hypothetical protein
MKRVPRTELEGLIRRYYELRQKIKPFAEEKDRIGKRIEEIMRHANLESYPVDGLFAIADQRLKRFYRITQAMASILDKAGVEALVSVGKDSPIGRAIKAGKLNPVDLKPFAVGKMEPYFTVRESKEADIDD